MQGAYRSYRQPGRQERPSEASPFDGPLGLCWVAPGARFEKEEISGGKSTLQTLLHPVALVHEKLPLVFCPCKGAYHNQSSESCRLPVGTLHRYVWLVMMGIGNWGVADRTMSKYLYWPLKQVSGPVKQHGDWECCVQSIWLVFGKGADWWLLLLDWFWCSCPQVMHCAGNVLPPLKFFL